MGKHTVRDPDFDDMVREATTTQRVPQSCGRQIVRALLRGEGLESYLKLGRASTLEHCRGFCDTRSCKTSLLRRERQEIPPR